MRHGPQPAARDALLERKCTGERLSKRDLKAEITRALTKPTPSVTLAPYSDGVGGFCFAALSNLSPDGRQGAVCSYWFSKYSSAHSIHNAIWLALNKWTKMQRVYGITCLPANREKYLHVFNCVHFLDAAGIYAVEARDAETQGAEIGIVASIEEMTSEVGG